MVCVMKRMNMLLCLIFVLCNYAFADTIHVPANYTTIQGAIDAAQEGDEVLVDPGTYVENIDYMGKGITLKSVDGPEVTVIDGNQVWIVVTFQSGETASSRLTGFTITNASGAGVEIRSASPVIEYNIIENNTGHWGGGIHCDDDTSPIIDHNIIRNNTAEYGGGGVDAHSASPIITNNTIMWNSGGSNGGGIACRYYSPATIINNLIFENDADWGGGIGCRNSSPTIKNCTVFNNSATDGGGIYSWRNSSPVLTNMIFWNNSAANGPEIWIGGPSASQLFSISYSDVTGGESSIWLETGFAYSWGSGMLDTDPLFIDAAQNDFHLQQNPCQPGVNNPCVDAGDPSSTMVQGSTRSDGIQDKAIVDLGFHYPLIEDDILMVPDEYSTIQSAIDDAADGDTVLVFAGTYFENLDFLGKRIVVKSSDGPEDTIIDASQSGSAAKFENGEGSDSILKGFTLTNGTGSVDPIGWLGGGGVYCDSYSCPTIEDNIIVENTAKRGGGIFCYNNSSPIIRGNRVGFNDVGTGYGSDGGGIFFRENCAPKMYDNIIYHNSSFWGGGIYCNVVTGDQPKIVNCVISCNQALHGGGIVCNSNAKPVIINSTIYGNYASNRGGGMLCWSGTAPIMVNSILWGNSSPSSPGIYPSSANLTATFCDIQGGWSGTGNINADPLFVAHAQEDLHLTFASPCRNAGDSSAVIEINDFEGDPRIYDGVVDMGADEFAPHLYYTGFATPGGSVDLKFIGFPDDTVRLWIGSGVLDPPIHHPVFGDWYLEPPLILGWILGDVPVDGVYILPVSIPPDYVPWNIPFQAGIDNHFSNLCVLKFE